ncbi:MAG: hypothetical protein ATN35_00305 [Epulopiscium sp. Nele67-Bin004]|nr:MAG: hypothetical protein ATN35_00305 [Epulopiscium sp. Nele67-Bin004]
MNKKFCVMVATLILSAQTVMASNINLIINSNIVVPSVNPVQVEGTTLVPVRIVSEQLGATVGWDSETETITISSSGKVIQLQIGNETAYVNGVQTELTLAPEIIEGTTMIPLRFVSENLNVPIDWDNDTQTVLINSSKTDLEKLPKNLTATQALDVLRETYSDQIDYSYQGMLESRLTVNDESGDNYYYFVMYEAGGELFNGVFCVHKDNARVFLIQGGVEEELFAPVVEPTVEQPQPTVESQEPTPEIFVPDIPEITTEDEDVEEDVEEDGPLTEEEIVNIAKQLLGRDVTYYLLLTEDEQNYYHFTTDDADKLSFIIRDDGAKIDAYQYDLDGSLLIMDYLN